MSYETIDQKLNAILELLKPKVKPAPVEELENVTALYKDACGRRSLSVGYYDQFTYIDGIHHGPAFVVERRKT